MVNDADESSLSKLCERLHQGLEEGGVVVLAVESESRHWTSLLALLR